MRGETAADGLTLDLQTGSPRADFLHSSLEPLGGGVCTVSCNTLKPYLWVSAGKTKAVNWNWWFLQEEDVMETCPGWDFTFTFTDFSNADACRLNRAA